MQSKASLALAACLSLSALGADAALVSRGHGMVYDTVRDLTWLADMNHARTSGYAAIGSAPVGYFYDANAVWTDGRMGYNAARAWADSLVFGGYSDWRLPTLNDGDTSCSQSVDMGAFGRQYLGFNCRGGELSGLFVTEFGNGAGESVTAQAGDTDTQKANLALFSNVQSAYWSDTGYAPTSLNAWLFDTSNGEQRFEGKSAMLHAVAVRRGDVGAMASVPEPQGLALVALALGAAGLAGRRRA